MSRARCLTRPVQAESTLVVDLDLKGKRAVVTGGSRGIGRAIVLALAQQGVSVAAVYQRESDAVTSLAEELERMDGDSYLVQADVSSESDVARLAEEARGRLGGIDVLVNNAGVVSHKQIEDLDLEEWRRIIDTNLTSLYLVTKAFVDAIPEGGSVINVGSAVAPRASTGLCFERSLQRAVSVRQWRRDLPNRAGLG